MSAEERIRAAARAAEDTVDEISELDPPVAPAQGSGRRMPRAGRWWTWAAPAAAVAAVIVLAASLVTVKAAPKAPQPAPARPAASTSAVPRYYAELVPHTEGQTERASLLVGDTLTGKTVATIAPPAGRSFRDLSAAADDRTFAVLAGPSIISPSSLTNVTGSWYLLRLAPGTASPARLTRIPGGPSSGIIASALSASGREFAVAWTAGKAKVPWLGVYSVATGRLLHSWSGRETPSFHFVQFGTDLGWLDGDHAIAFSTGVFGNQTVRRLDVAAAGSDLIKDSRVIWTTPKALPGHPGCNLFTYLPVTADGKTVLCQATALNQTTNTVRWTMQWLAYPVAAPKAAPRVLYRASITAPLKDSGLGMVTLWVSTSDSVMLVDWSVSGSTGVVSMLHFGSVSHGTFTPLKVPPDDQSLEGGPPGIVWLRGHSG